MPCAKLVIVPTSVLDGGLGAATRRFVPPVVVVDEPASHQVLVVFDVLVQLAELADLEHDDPSHKRDKKQERIQPPRYEVAEMWTSDHEGDDAICCGVRDGKR